MRNASAESRREEIARAMRVRDHDAIIASHYNVSLISVAAFVMSLDEHEADRQKLRSIECLRGAFGPVEDENKHPYQNLHPGTCLHVLAAELLLEHMRTELGAQTNPPSPKLRELPSTRSFCRGWCYRRFGFGTSGPRRCRFESQTPRSRSF